ncbi:MAG: VCBS repeat-containing protein, partial [Planctomycetota bacterium]
MNPRRFAIVIAFVLAMSPSRAWTYIEVPHSFGQIVGQASNIVLMRVEAVDKEKNLIVYRKVRDVKGVHPQEVIKHNIGRNGLRPDEWKPTMAWAEPGKMAVFFYVGGASETCIGNWWYQAYAGGEWWNHVHGEPFLLRSYCGPPEKLPALVTAMMENREVIVPCMVDGDKEALHNRTAKIQRLKASLKLQNFDQKRDFVGWGGEEFRRLQGMPGFSHITALARTDPDAQSISAVDFDNDGKVDLCLVGGGKLIILQNNGDSMSEISLPGIDGARSAVWGDYNGDGLPDALVVCSAGPKLFTNLGKGLMRNDTHLLPREPFYHLTAAAWADVDGDGRPDLILANGYHGLRVYRNVGLPIPPIPALAKFGPWSFLGPVDYNLEKGFEAPHPAEALDLKAEYVGKGGHKIRWQPGNFTDGATNNLLNLFPADMRTWVGAYLHRTIEVDVPTKLPVSFGSDDTLTVWLDGKKLISDPSHRTCAADQNTAALTLAPGKHELLMKICQSDEDFAFYFNYPKLERPIPQGLAFEDISKKSGLGLDGPATNLKHDSLAVCDVDGDGLPDFLYGNLLFLNRPGADKTPAFVESKNCGLDFQPYKAGAVFGDFDNDGVPDLFVPQKTTGKLYKGDGAGRFVDVTAQSGDLSGPLAWATSAAWGDLDTDGNLDLVVGCFKGPNRFFKGDGKGGFVDATAAVGLDQKIFNTQAVACVDLNGDGQLDLVFNNEGQDSNILLGSGGLASTKRMPLTLRVQSSVGATGSQARVVDKAGKTLATQSLYGGAGRGSQQANLFRFALEPGAYQVQLRLSNGQILNREFTIGDSPVRGI